MAKQDIVYVLGAGASVGTGVPAMTTFVDRMYDLFFEMETEEYKNVFKAISQLRQVYANSHLDLNNIESVLAAFDMGRLVKQLGTFREAEAEMLYKALVRMIVNTVERTTWLEGDGTNTWVRGAYGEFVGRAIDRSRASKSRCDFITLNYDIALDFCLMRYGEVEYGFDHIVDSPLLLKLHGSANWFNTPNGIVPVSLRTSEIIEKGQKETLDYQRLPNGSKHLARIHFSQRTDYQETFIVPPSYSKHFNVPQMEAVWGNAARLLSNADVIVFIGYSVPPSDLMFRYLFGIGTLENNRIRKILCLDPNIAVEETYREFLGQFTAPRLTFVKGSFDSVGLDKLFVAMPPI